MCRVAQGPHEPVIPAKDYLTDRDILQETWVQPTSRFMHRFVQESSNCCLKSSILQVDCKACSSKGNTDNQSAVLNSVNQNRSVLEHIHLIHEASAVWRSTLARQLIIPFLLLEAIIIGQLLTNAKILACKKDQVWLALYLQNLSVHAWGAAMVLQAKT